MQKKLSGLMLTGLKTLNFSIQKSGRRMMHCYLIIFFTILLWSCNASKSLPAPSEIPACLQEMILKMSADISEGTPLSITQFTYRGQKVYYMVAPCCDKFNIVFDSVCTILGYPDGGFTGRGDGKMAGFAKETIDPKVIWEAKKDVNGNLSK